MIGLERHIEILLLDNNCVIVPGLGGFMVHYVGAHYDSKDRLFLPPLRTIGFNPRLKMNDSLLVQSYVEAYDLSYPEALLRVESEVSELLSRLEEERKYYFNDIGTLSINDNGDYEFAPCEAGILTPELYGLFSFEIERLEEEQTPAVPANTAKAEEEGRAVKIRVSLLRNIAAAAIAIFAIFLVSPQFDNATSGMKTMNIGDSAMSLLRLMPKKKAAAPAKEPATPAMKQARPAATAPEKATATPKENTAAAEKAAPEKAAVEKADTAYYTIVLASRVTEPNANEYAGRLRKEGLEDVSVYKSKGNSIKVICGRYSTEGKAYAALNRMRSNEAFSQCWVYKVK